MPRCCDCAKLSRNGPHLECFSLLAKKGHWISKKDSEADNDCISFVQRVSREKEVLKIVSIGIRGDTQPDFDKLLKLGWKRPDIGEGQLSERMLTKDYGGLRVDILRHIFTGNASSIYKDYTDIFVGSAQDDPEKPYLKGHGAGYSVDEVLGVLVWLESELNQAV